MKKEQTSFQIKHHHRHNLRTWIRENFGFVEKRIGCYYNRDDVSILKERALEVVEACNKVAEIDRRVNSAYVDYYRNDWKRINEAYEKRDFQDMAKALEDLLGGIDWE